MCVCVCVWVCRCLLCVWVCRSLLSSSLRTRGSGLMCVCVCVCVWVCRDNVCMRMCVGVSVFTQLFSAHPWIWGKKKAPTETNGKNKRYLKGTNGRYRGSGARMRRQPRPMARKSGICSEQTNPVGNKRYLSTCGRVCAHRGAWSIRNDESAHKFKVHSQVRDGNCTPLQALSRYQPSVLGVERRLHTLRVRDLFQFLHTRPVAARLRRASASSMRHRVLFNTGRPEAGCLRSLLETP